MRLNLHWASGVKKWFVETGRCNVGVAIWIGCVCAGHSHRDPGDISAIKHPAVCAAVMCVWRNCLQAKISARLLPVKRFSWLEDPLFVNTGTWSEFFSGEGFPWLVTLLPCCVQVSLGLPFWAGWCWRAVVQLCQHPLDLSARSYSEDWSQVYSMARLWNPQFKWAVPAGSAWAQSRVSLHSKCDWVQDCLNVRARCEAHLSHLARFSCL